VVVGGRLLLRQLFRAVAWSKMAEVFTATSLLVVVGTAWLVQTGRTVDGTRRLPRGPVARRFEFRHELEAQIEPFKGLLLGLFFIAVGMSIDLFRVRAEPLLIGGGVLVLLLVKGLVLYAVAWRPGRLRRASADAGRGAGPRRRDSPSWCSPRRSATACWTRCCATGWWRWSA
jgi:Kef-type K+ transport system membrane component KefB